MYDMYIGSEQRKRAHTMNPNAKQWVITYAKVDADGQPVFRTDTALADSDTELRRVLIDYGVPGFHIDVIAAREVPSEWRGNNTRVTWAFTRPSLPTQRAALMTELRGLSNVADWRGVLDTVAARGVYLGKTARWRDACLWFGEAERAGRSLEWIAIQGLVNLAHAL